MLQILSIWKDAWEQFILDCNSTEAVSSDTEIKFDEDIVLMAENSNGVEANLVKITKPFRFW
jgi:hypothetical protein